MVPCIEMQLLQFFDHLLLCHLVDFTVKNSQSFVDGVVERTFRAVRGTLVAARWSRFLPNRCHFSRIQDLSDTGKIYTTEINRFTYDLTDVSLILTDI